MPTKEDIIQAISNLTPAEADELRQILEEKWGIHANPIPVYGGPPVPYCPGCGQSFYGPHACPGPQRAAAPAYGPPPGFRWPDEDRCDFVASLTNLGSRKIEVIKLVREQLGLGLVDAKNLVDAVQDGHSRVLKGDLIKAEADLLQYLFEAVGAKVEIK